jgi:predicted ATPase/DNA-binding winged helix-turn-helix (wHTH) protein
LADNVLAFSSFQLSPGRRTLLRDGKAVRLGGRALDLLVVLLEQAGKVVSKEVLFERVWPNLFVDETNLRLQVAALRKVLGGGASGERFIHTVAGRGYCFVAKVVKGEDEHAAAAPPRVAENAHNLPAQLTRMIGRDKALDLVAGRLRRQRFVTIVGPGGIGKTTFALAIAGNLISAYADGVRFINLGPVADRRLVASTLASELGVAADPNDPLPGVVAYLRTKSMLVVLDNCEHVIEAAAALAEGILTRTPGVHLLATSREPLRAEGETIHRLSTLAVPPRSDGAEVATALGFAAVELFVERATAALDSFALTDRNLLQVCDICRRLDGIPLAIELAAARVDLGLEALSTKLASSFFLHAKGRRTALPRQRTLGATLDWSHALLSAAEQVAFRRLALMAGDFTTEAATAVVGDGLVSASDVPLMMADLHDKSLIATDVGGKTIQYRLYETVRAYAGEKLAQSGEGGEIALRHAQYFLDLMRRADSEWNAARGNDWLSTYRGNIDNVRGAIDWSMTPAGDEAVGVALTLASAQLWFQLSLMAEYRERIERALQRLLAAPARQPDLEMRLHVVLGYTLWYASFEHDAQQRAFGRARELAVERGDAMVELQALWGLWAGRRGRGEYRAALELARQYEAMAEKLGDPRMKMLGDRILGLTHHYLGNQEPARRLLERVRREARESDQNLDTDFQYGAEVATTVLLCRIQWLQGHPDQAMKTAQEAIDAAERTGHGMQVVYVMMNSGCAISLLVGDLAEARRRLDAILDQGAGNPHARQWARCYRLILRLRQGSERDALIAAFMEPRLDFSTIPTLLAMTGEASPSLPMPGAPYGEAEWSLPELLRVDAELIRWRGGPDAAAAAEAKLLQSLEVARRQETLSWELRTATSLARLWRDGGRASEGRDLLAATLGRFTEGFETADLVEARRLLESWT